MARRKKQKPILPLILILVACCLIAVATRKHSAEAAGEPTCAHSEKISDLEAVALPAGTVSRMLSYPGFTVSFNRDYKQPNYVVWELTREESVGDDTSREDHNFAPDPNVEGCATVADYKGSGFDRGHMCPAGDMKWSHQAMGSSFLLTNICPQAHALNSGAWKSVEENCRIWAKRDSAIVIICGPVLTDKLTRIIGPSEVPVPERFFKVILAPYAQPMRGIGFIMPNGNVRGGMQAAAVSIDEVEAITGFDFFASLPDDIENAVEKQCNLPSWNKK